MNNKAVLGECQLHRYVPQLVKDRVLKKEVEKLKRVKSGKPIQGYYGEPMISDDLFKDAKLARDSRARVANGRAGEEFKNIFKGLLRCGYCQREHDKTIEIKRKKFSELKALDGVGHIHTMVMEGIHSSINRNQQKQYIMGFSSAMKKTKDGKTKIVKGLYCRQHFKGLGCVKNHWNYDLFEISFLTHYKEISFDKLVDISSSEYKLSTIQNDLFDNIELSKECKDDLDYGVFQASCRL